MDESNKLVLDEVSFELNEKINCGYVVSESDFYQLCKSAIGMKEEDMKFYSTNETDGDLVDCTLEGSLTVDNKTWELDGGVKFDYPPRLWSKYAFSYMDEEKYCSVISSNILSLVEKVIINPPATIVIWKDGHKEVVKCSKDEDFNPEVGVAMCFMKRIFKSRNQFTKLVDGAWNEYKKKFQKDIEKHLNSHERFLCLYRSIETNSLYFDEAYQVNNDIDICYGEVESFKDALYLAETNGWRQDGKRLVNDMIKSTESIYSLKQDYDRKLSKLKSAQIKQGL